MGFDLYGKKPIEREFKHQERYNELSSMSYEERSKKSLNDEYFELTEQYEELNHGAYFRNNVWWWRPLWNFVCNTCDDFLTDKDMDFGHSNDNHFINKSKSLKIAKKLQSFVDDGTVDKVQKINEKIREESKKKNHELQVKIDELNDKVIKETGKELAPIDYPNKYKKQWDKLYAQRDWDASYPFHKDNVVNFIQFCKESGGFYIC